MWAIIAAVIAVAASAGVYYQQRKMEAQAKKQAQEAKAVQISGHDSNRGLYTVYGKALIGSTTVWKKVSDKQTRMTQTGFTTFSRGTGDLINGTRDLKSNRFLYRAVSLCAGPIQSVENILIDDEGYQSSRFGQGDDRHFAAAVSLGPTAGQNFSAMRTSYADFNAWGSTFTGKGVAYAIERLYLDNDKPAYQGEPSTKYLVKGRKLYDPRKDSTSSVYDATLGTSSHRFATPTTWEWSDNPVLALLDYMTNSEYGRGLALSVIDLPSIAEAADKCDELVDIPARLTNTTGSSYDFYDPESGQVITVPVNTNIPNYRPEQGSSSQQKRFRINIAIDPSKELLDNIQEILNVFRGNLSYANGKYRVHMADVASPVLTIGDDDIITGLKISNGDRSQRMNRATVKFINANKQHKTDQASWPSLDSNEDDGLYDTYLTEDQGERLHKTFTIKGCTDFYQAQDTAEFLVRDSRSNLTVAGTFGSRCFGLVPGDVVSLTYDSAGYSGKYFRVMQVAIDLNSMNVNLQLKEYDSSVYTWNDARGNEPEGLTWQEEVVNASPTTPVIGTLSSTTRTRADGSTALTLTVPFSNIPEQAQYVDVEWGINGTDQYNSQVVFDTENINQVEVPIERDNQTYAVRVRYFIADSAGTLMASTFATDTITVGNLTGTKLEGIEEGATANNIYQQDDEPTGGTYNDGDIWIDTNDGYRMYLRSGGAWVDRADTRIATAITDAAGAQATADGKVVTFFQDAEPADASSSTGDLWIDTNDSNKLYRYNGTSWDSVRDSGIASAISAASTAQSTADGKIVTFYQDDEPAAASSSTGDLWFDTNDNNKLYRYNGTDWVSARDAGIATALSNAATAQSTADGKIVTFYQDGEPAAASSSEGDLWIDTNDNNKLYRFNGTDWQAARDSGIATAISDAATAQATADGKVTTFYAASTATPTPEGTGDLWYQTDTALFFRYNGSAWQEVASYNTGDLADLDTVGTTQIDDDAVTIDKIANTLQSTNYSAGSAGWKLTTDGTFEAGNGTFRGALTATSLTLDSSISIGSANIDSTVVDGAEAGATALQIGDVGNRNYVRYSGNWNSDTISAGWTSYSTVTLSLDTTTTYAGLPTLKIVTDSTSGSDAAYTVQTQRLKPNTVYTASALVKGSSALTGADDRHLHIQSWTVENSSNVHQETRISMDGSITTDWKLITNTFRTPDSDDATYSRVYFYNLADNYTLNVAYVKLEEGLNATDWTPALEDQLKTGDAGLKITDSKLYQGTGTHNNTNTGFYLDSSGKFSLKDKLSFDGTTLSVDGNVTVDEFVKAGSGSTAAVMSGRSADNFAFWAGADFDANGGASGANAPFRVTRAGKVIMTNFALYSTTGQKLFDSTDGLLGLPSTQVAASTGSLVSSVSDELTGATDYATIQLSSTQTITVDFDYPLNYLFASGTSEANAYGQIATSITVTIQKSTDASTWSTFGSVTFNKTDSSSASTSQYYVQKQTVYLGSEFGGGTLYFASLQPGGAVDDGNVLNGNVSASLATGTHYLRMQVTYGGSGLAAGGIPSTTAARSITLTTTGAGFTVDSSGNVSDGVATSATTGWVTSNFLAKDSSGNVTVPGNLTVQGDTVQLNTATLNVEDKNIILNYAAGDTSGSADGAGITIQDAVNANTDASLTWNATSDYWNLSHHLQTPSITNSGSISSQYFVSYGGQELILAAGESVAQLVGVTGGNPLQGEYVYAVAEGGLQVISSPNNWIDGSNSYNDVTWAQRKLASINKSDGQSDFPAQINVTGHGNSSQWNTAYGWGNHASAGYLTGNQTITLTGDATGSGTTSITVTVANDSHTHDGRYFTETESDDRYLRKDNGNFNWTRLGYGTSGTAYWHKLATVTVDSAYDDYLLKAHWTDRYISGELAIHIHSDNDTTADVWNAYVIQNGVTNKKSISNFKYSQSGSTVEIWIYTPGWREFDYYRADAITEGTPSITWYKEGDAGVGKTTTEPSGLTAFADYTPLHASNDGANSGYDADTVDGIQAANFLRSDVSDVYDGRVLQFGTAGNGQNTAGAFLTIEGNTASDGEGSGRLFFREHNSTTASADNYGMSLGYRGGSTSVTTAMGNTWTGLANIGNGEWGMWGHDNNATGALVMHGPRNGSYVDFSNAKIANNQVWHAGNDGSGSGLDADLLDGLNSTSFVRADTTDTMSGHLKVEYNGVTTTPGYTQGQVELYTSSNYVPALGFHRSGYSATTLYENDGQLYVNPWVTRAQAGLLLSTGNIGTYAWTSSNDGSGSTLDADLLDGQHGSYYALYNDIRSLGAPAFTAGGGSNSSTTTATLISEMEGDGAFDSYTSVFKTPWSYATNDNLTDAGRFTETAGTSWITWTDNASDSARGYITALAIAPNTGGSAGKVFIYNDQGSSYSPGWREVWTSTSDGSGSGLDADLLDGLHASQFVRSDADDTITGNLTIEGTSPQIKFTDTNNGDVWIHVNSERFYILPDRDSSGGWETPYAMELNFATNSAYIFSNTVWTAGSDGSGSGLDADLLDGLHETGFVRTSGGVSSNLDSDYRAGMIGWSPSTSGTKPGSSYGQLIKIVSSGDSHNNTNNWITQLAFGTDNNTAFFRSKTNSGGWYGWRTFWHTGNDGAGSGLDADTLDGNQSSFFADKTNSQSFSAEQTFTGMARVVSGSIGTTNTTNGLVLDGNYTNGQYRHRWRKQDNGGGVPLYLDYAAGVANSYSALARFGIYTGNPYEFEVYGDINATGNVYDSGNPVWHSGNDASGSGLDADLLDGLHGSSYAYGVRGTYTSLSGSSGNWFPVAYISDGTALVAIRTYAHSSVLVSIGKGYTASNQSNLQILSATQNANGSYANVTGVRIRASGWLEVQLSWSSGPYVSVGVQVLPSTGSSYSVAGSLAATTATDSIFDQFYISTGTSNFRTVSASGNITAYASDARLKENVTTITGALEKVQRLRGVEFDWRDDCADLGFYPTTKHETGVIAQEVREVIEDAAYPAPFNPDYLTVQKDKIVPVLIEAVKDLIKEVESLKAMLKEKDDE